MELQWLVTMDTLEGKGVTKQDKKKLKYICIMHK